MFSDEDIVAIRVNNVCRKGGSFRICIHGSRRTSSAQFTEDLLFFTENEHRKNTYRCQCISNYIWGSSNINPQGEHLLAYCASADLNFCNVGNKPSFRTNTLEELLNLTLVNRCAWDRVVEWRVSNVPSFSDHIYIRFQVESRIQKQAKMFGNVFRMCWNKYANKLK